MKLVPIATLVGAALGSDLPQSNKYCINSKPWGHAWFGRRNDPSFDAHDNFIADSLANSNDSNIDDVCANARSACADYNDIDANDDFGAKMNIWRRKNGRKCGAQANKAILNKLVCSMCDLAQDDDAAAAADAQVNDQSVSGQRAVGEEGSQFAGFINMALVNSFDENAMSQLEAQNEVPEGQRTVTPSKCTHGGACKLRWDIKRYFAGMTQDIWNIVYSGGPEYCTDMMPRYPKVNFGKMKPGHPNYHSVVAIRDACVALQKLVQQVKCACLYIIWGSRNYPKPSDKGFRFAHGKTESHMCWYFSQLKGTGLWKPAKKPVSTQCVNKKKPGSGGPTRYVTLTSCRALRNKKHRNNCFKKLKQQGNTNGH